MNNLCVPAKSRMRSGYRLIANYSEVMLLDVLTNHYVQLDLQGFM